MEEQQSRRSVEQLREEFKSAVCGVYGISQEDTKLLDAITDISALTTMGARLFVEETRQHGFSGANLALFITALIIVALSAGPFDEEVCRRAREYVGWRIDEA